MRWLDRLAIGLVAAAGAAIAADEPARRHAAPIVVEADAPLLRLPLPLAAYTHSVRPRVADLRVVDADGAPVPFALLPPRADAVERSESQRPAALYAQPPRPNAGGEWTSPLELRVQGDRISVTTRRGAPPVSSGAAKAPPGGWLFDLGEPVRDVPAPNSLRLVWTAPAEFSAAFTLQTSADLREWRAAGSGQLLALAAPAADAASAPSRSLAQPLTQPLALLPGGVARFVRLVWIDPVNAPALTRAEAVTQRPRSTPLDPPAQWTATPLPARADSSDALDRRALEFDFGGVLPLVDIDLQLGPGTRIAPMRIQGRERADMPWRELGAAVFYRFEAGGEGGSAGASSASSPLPLRVELRHLRLLADPRSPLPERDQVRLVVRADLASIVFARQGRAPYRVQTGAEQAAPAALPLATLVPRLEDERARFGRASLGAWSEDEGAARAAEAARRMAAWRPWLLWAVLLAGVAGLGFMVWRLRG